MHGIVFAQSARKSLKRLSGSGSFPAKKASELFNLLQEGKALPAPYQDHQLKGVFSHCRECHLGFNLLVQYERDEKLHLVVIVAVGTHDDLF